MWTQLPAYRKEISVFILLLFHVSGFIGLCFTPYTTFFLTATPLNLILTLAIILWNEPMESKILSIISFTIFLCGLGVEILGVNTGFPFGNYYYGDVLGPKVMGTPLLIGVNWLILVLCTAQITPFKTPLYIAAYGAVLMTAADFIIEPVATRLRFWNWKSDIIPLQNYMAWFIISFFLLFYFCKFKKNRENNPAVWIVFVTQIGFFILLQLFYPDICSMH